MTPTQARLLRHREELMDSEGHSTIMKSLPATKDMISLKTEYPLNIVRELLLELHEAGLVKFDRWKSQQWEINEGQLEKHFKLINK